LANTQRRATKLQRAVSKRLGEIGDPKRAEQQRAYMKSTIPFAGVAAPELKKLGRELYAAHPLESSEQWQAEVLGLFKTNKYRELRYLAIELAYYKPYRPWLTSSVWNMLDELVTTGAWWDVIDALAPNHYAHLLANEPTKVKPLLRKYARDNNIWRRRVAILCQLKAKATTDEALLFNSLDQSLDHPEFFVRKAIGWALRAHSRTNPGAVVDYVTTHANRLSPLSKREGLKLLLKAGTLTKIP